MAQALRHFFDEPLRWSIKLPHAPRRGLEYIFTSDHENENKEDFSISEHREAAYNIEQTKVETKNKRDFDQKTIIQIVVSEDGTVRPKFIYKSANLERRIEENSEEVRPFFLDMTTDSDQSDSMSHYVGFDFGTSNSSVCCLSNDEINITEARDADEEWSGIGDASHSLPFPVAVSIRDFLNPRNHGREADLSRTVFEACLSFLAYTLASEAAQKNDFTNEIQQFHHRSLGPLKALLFAACSKLKWRSDFIDDLSLIKDKNEEIDTAIQDMTDIKHDKMNADSNNLHGHVGMIVKLTATVLKDIYFGFCFSSEKKPLESKYRGNFLVAHDLEPFRIKIPYTSDIATDGAVALVVNRKTGACLSTTPFYLFWQDNVTESGHVCFLLDVFKSKGGNPTVKPCGRNEILDASQLDLVVAQSINKLYDKGSISTHDGNITFLPDDMERRRGQLKEL